MGAGAKSSAGVDLDHLERTRGSVRGVFIGNVLPGRLDQEAACLDRLEILLPVVAPVRILGLTGFDPALSDLRIGAHIRKLLFYRPKQLSDLSFRPEAVRNLVGIIGGICGSISRILHYIYFRISDCGLLALFSTKSTADLFLLICIRGSFRSSFLLQMQEEAHPRRAVVRRHLRQDVNEHALRVALGEGDIVLDLDALHAMLHEHHTDEVLRLDRRINGIFSPLHDE